MYAAVLTGPGAVPTWTEFEEPVISEDEVLVEVRAASIKRIDRAIAAGIHYTRHATYPTVVGIDGIGVANGERVYFGAVRSLFGTMAERAPARKEFLIPVSADIDDATAAAIPNAAMSTWLPLAWQAGLQPGETVAILGATGTSGRMGVQVARHLGAGKVIAAGRNREVLDQLDADAVVDLGRSEADVIDQFLEAGGDHGYDVVLDFLWGEPASRFIQAMARSKADYTTRRTRFVQIGSLAGEEVNVPASVLRSTGLQLSGSGVGSVAIGDVLSMVPQAWALAEQGVLVVPTESMPLADVATAWERGDHDGRRLVLTMS